jgi:hypothetical protein
MICQTDLTTLVLNYAVNPLIILVFLVLGALKLRKGKASSLNLYLGTFFMFVVAGILINIIYAALAGILDQATYTFLNRLTGAVIFYGVIFTLYFTIALQKGIAAITPAFRVAFFVIWGVVISIMLFIGQSTLTGPLQVMWDPVLGWYAIFVVSLEIVLIFIYSGKILNVMSNRSLKLKYGSFLVGIIIMFIGLLCTVLTHMNLLSSSISAVFFLIGIIPAGYLIYYGIDKGQKSA